MDKKSFLISFVLIVLIVFFLGRASANPIRVFSDDFNVSSESGDVSNVVIVKGDRNQIEQTPSNPEPVRKTNPISDACISSLVFVLLVVGFFFFFNKLTGYSDYKNPSFDDLDF